MGPQHPAQYRISEGIAHVLPFKLVYSEHYRLPLGEHVFQADKYQRVRSLLLDEGIATEADFLEPSPAKEEDALLVHSHFYVDKLMEGTLTAREELQMEIPYSFEAVQSFLWHTGGTILAAERALADGAAFNLGGGFHHAFPDHGEGFCMLHDVAIAIRKLQKTGRIRRAMTVDCDVHQGNGTAAIFASRSRRSASDLPSRGGATLGEMRRGTMVEQAADDVFTISLHQENNYPLQKPPSSIDVNLPDGTGDDDYLSWLDNALSSALRQFEPDLICYIAGADPFREDQLGGLNLTLDGLKRRDDLVFQAAWSRRVPVCVTFAGGYAKRIEDTIAIHSNTVLSARDRFRMSKA